MNPANDFVSCLPSRAEEDLGASGTGGVTRWSQVRAGWPNREPPVWGRTDSGTYDYFTEAIVGEEGATGATLLERGRQRPRAGHLGDRDALGFFVFAYTTRTGSSEARGVDGATDASALPADHRGRHVSAPLQAFVRHFRKNSLSRPEVRAFADYAITNAVALVNETGYIPLQDEVYRLARGRIAQGITGSIYDQGGSQVGTKLGDLLAAEEAGAGAGEPGADTTSPGAPDTSGATESTNRPLPSEDNG